jgi:hypothetical protein
MIFGSKKCWIPSTRKPSKVLAIGIRYEMNDLYKLDIVQTNIINLLDFFDQQVVEENISTKLWHRHLKHLHFQGLIIFLYWRMIDQATYPSFYTTHLQ